MTTTHSNPSVARMTPVVECSRKLRLLFEMEREFCRTVTTLIPRLGDPHLKYRLCEHLWESIQHAKYLRERGHELSGFGRTDQVRIEIRLVFEEIIRSQEAGQALTVFYRVFKPALLQWYREYLRLSDQLADWPTTKLIEEFIQDEIRHGTEMAASLSGESSKDKWAIHLEEAIAQLQKMWEGTDISETRFDWLCEKESYQHPEWCERAPYPRCGTDFGTDPDEVPLIRPWLEDNRTDARVMRVMMYVWLMNEMDAVDYLATVIYDTPEAPLDMHYDMARHLWDESRHSQFGFRQLPKLGVDLSTVEQRISLYPILLQMTPPERYAVMTMVFEAGSFDVKAKIMDRLRDLNDFEMDTLMAFDRNDEQNHVRYGHRWLPHLLKMFGEERDAKQFVADASERFNALQQKIEPGIGHELPAEKRLTGNKILAMYGLTSPTGN